MTNAPPSPQPLSPALIALSVAVPLALLALTIYLFTGIKAEDLGAVTVPNEVLHFERVAFYEERAEAQSGGAGGSGREIVAWVRNVGRDDIAIGTVYVNEAIVAKEHLGIEGGRTLARWERKKITIQHDWEDALPYEIKVLTKTGFAFTYEAELATPTPVPTVASALKFGLLGVYAGVIPVFLGLLWLPFLRLLPPRAWGWILSFTIGLLIFIGVETLKEALEFSERIAEVYNGVGIAAIGVAGSMLGLIVAGQALRGKAREEEAPDRRALLTAYFIALGIGLHNLGEGLAIGTSYLQGEVVVGAQLVIGFTIHNLTEGFAIVGPLASRRARLHHFLWLGLLAGAPTVAGTWIGGFTYAGPLSVLFMAVGAGAVFQVVGSILKEMRREAGGGSGVNAGNAAAFLLGMVVMYATGLLTA